MARARKRFRGHQRRWLLTIIVMLVVSGVGWWFWDQQGQGRQTHVQAAEGNPTSQSALNIPNQIPKGSPTSRTATHPQLTV